MINCIVIGSGILGASTAYALSKLGANLTIIDRNDHGQATNVAAGIICPWVSQRRNKKWYTLAKNGARIYEELIDELSQYSNDIGYVKAGTLCLQQDDNKLQKMYERTLKRKEEAPEIGELTILNETESKAYFPLLKEGYKALHVSGGARVNGRELRDALLLGAKALGAKFIAESAYLNEDSDGNISVSIRNEKLQADHIIVTTGAWLEQLMKPLYLSSHVTAQKAQLIQLDIKGYDTANWPVIMPPNNQYLLPYANGRFIIGTTYEETKQFDPTPSAGGIYEILSKAFEIAPALEHASLSNIKVGFRPVAPEFLPFFGKSLQYKNLYLANGLGASGLTTGPYIGSILAKLVMNEEITELDVSLYAPQHITVKTK